MWWAIHSQASYPVHGMILLYFGHPYAEAWSLNFQLWMKIVVLLADGVYLHAQMFYVPCVCVLPSEHFDIVFKGNRYKIIGRNFAFSVYLPSKV